MKQTLITMWMAIGLCASAFAQDSTHDDIKPYVDFLTSESFLSPKEYVLGCFDDNDIVILSERDHREFTQYEMIVDIVQDKRFTGNIYTEVGVFNSEKRINAFLQQEGLSDSEVKTLLLDIFKHLDMFPLWPNTNFYYLLESIYQINQQRESTDKIKVFPLDLVFSWDSIQCNEQYHMFLDMMEPQNDLPPVINRNSILAKHFIRKYSEEKKSNPGKDQALVIMNTYHGYTRIPAYLPYPTEPRVYSTAEYIYQTFPTASKGIMVNYYPTSRNPVLIADGKWDAAFKTTGNKHVGFDLKDTPFGDTKFDLYNFGGTAYEAVDFDYIFDGLVFYTPIDDFEIIVGIPGIFDDTAFVTEFYRRVSIEENMTMKEAMSSRKINQYMLNWNVRKVKEIERLDELNKQMDKWLTK